MVKTVFSDCVLESFMIQSKWNKQSIKTLDKSNQTDDALYQTSHSETQTGKFENFYEFIVDKTEDTLIDTLRVKSHYKRFQLSEFIENGNVYIDGEICTNAETKVHSGCKVKLFAVSQSMETQTIEFNEIKEESKDQFSDENKSLNNFLSKSSGILTKEIQNSLLTKAFHGYYTEFLEGNSEIINWGTLSVDLEKNKIIFPDWKVGSYVKGTIIKSNLTRTKERTYDIEYEDSTIIQNVREEYIRMLNDGILEDRENKSKKSIKHLLEGVRVHAKTVLRNGEIKYLPGRLIKIKGDYLDVECENGGKLVSAISVDDILIGIQEGQLVEALSPSRISLESTDVSWNRSGNIIGASFGRNDITGWCTYPGVICIWNVFMKTFQRSKPDLILDHSSCLQCISFHPQSPSLVCAGSFNGEVIIWDLNKPESPLYISVIGSECCHSEPIIDITWVFDFNNQIWLIVSAGSDGKILTWSMENKLNTPINMSILGSPKIVKKSFPFSLGCSSISYSVNLSSKWMLIGQNNGYINAIPHTVFYDKPSSNDLIRSANANDFTFTNIKSMKNSLSIDSHIGAVMDIDHSPFLDNVFVTCGVDGCINLYFISSDTQELIRLGHWDPILNSGTEGETSIFTSITGVKFSPSRASVFAISTSSGCIYLYDISISISNYLVKLEVTGDDENEFKKNFSRLSQKSSLTSLAFNNKQRGFLAATDTNGRIHIWKLSWKWANEQIQDINLIRKWNKYHTI